MRHITTNAACPVPIEQATPVMDRCEKRCGEMIFGRAGMGTAAGIIAAAVTLAMGTTAQADDSPPLKSGEVIRDRGFVARVTDGDTLRFARTPDRRTSNYDIIRLIGIQAPEVSRKGFHAGECNGDLAQAALVELAEGRKAVLASAHNTRDSDRGRDLRTVYVQHADGTWVDLAAEMMRQGWGQWFPKKTEPVHNLEYRQLADAAQAAHLNIWNPTNCGTAYSAGATLQMWIQSDPSGNDWKNVNGEYIRILNTSADVTADVSNWSLRDGSLNWLRFPNGTSIAPGRYLTVRVGMGRNDADTLYWGRKRPVFSNLNVTPDYMGDGAYLIDRQGNVRASYVYPCMGACVDARAGSVHISKVRDDPPGNEVRKPNQEYIRITNTGDQAYSMLGYEMRIGGWTHEFGSADTLAPGGSLTVRIGRGVPSGATRYFGMAHSLLDNSGDLIALRSFDARIVDCYGYGRLRNRTCD